MVATMESESPLEAIGAVPIVMWDVDDMIDSIFGKDEEEVAALDRCYSFDTPPKKAAPAKSVWGSPLDAQVSSSSWAAALRDAPSFPVVAEAGSSTKKEKDTRSTSKEEEAVAPNWIRG
eukprot:236946-Karenia_brevis.AAC.1